MLTELEKDFWEHVQNELPPALDGSTASEKFLADRFPDSIPKSKIELPEITPCDLIVQIVDDFVLMK